MRTLYCDTDNTGLGAQALMSLLQDVFQMSSEVLKRGSDAWIAAIIKSQKFSYLDCCKYAPLMKACVTKMMNDGDTKGYPIVCTYQKVPTDEIYTANPDRLIKYRATSVQKELPFLRASAFQAAVLGCKNACLYPVQVSYTVR